MHKLIEVLKKQLETEKNSAIEKLTSGNLDTIYKLTCAIRNLECMEDEEPEVASETVVMKYSNGRYDHNIDALYDAYIAAKQAYQTNGDQGHRDKLMESVGRLMTEVYDLLSCMAMDADFQDEKKAIMMQIRKLAEM